MKHEKRVHITLRSTEFTALVRLKTRYEEKNGGSSTGWGQFISYLVGFIEGAKLLEPKATKGEDDDSTTP